MRSLIDLLFSNLIPIVIAVSVIIRVIMAIRNAATRKKEQPAPPAYKQDDGEEEVGVWSRLRPDDDDDDKPPPYPTMVSPPAFTSLGASEPPPEPLAAPLAQGEIPPVSTQNNFPTAAFFRRISGFPPMRQAVILAEILGPPKGD